MPITLHFRNSGNRHSGYWGAARDRIPASANDLLSTEQPEPLVRAKNRETKGQGINVTPPRNLTVIRSGVSWQDCGKEQLQSYTNNLKPVLDKGMEYLANYGRAQNERMKYQEKLELRTNHEVYVIDGYADFEYVNCHNQTGLLPYF